MHKVVIATGNDRTFARIRDLIADDNVEFISHSDAEIELPVESGTTYDQNAMEIADKVARASGMVTIAEASGIEVDALDGAPGVSATRYAGTDASEEENRQELLHDVDEAGFRSRAARLVTSIAVAHPDGRLQAFGSTLEGLISNEERGVEGDGYEPIFELDDGMTIAELLPEARDRVHPRAVALAEARPFLMKLLADDNASR
jgi:XTP/dITP diphosphohydrolase